MGGTSRVIKYLIEMNLIDGNCLTITGKTLWENVKDQHIINFTNQKIILPLNKPFKKESHIKILKGNLSPAGSLCKIYKNNNFFSGKAHVYDNEADMINALKEDKIKKNNIIVIRYQGESIGCPKMSLPTSALTEYFNDNVPPIITDGRFSGEYHGVLVAHLPDAYKKMSMTRIIKNDDKIEINLLTNEINLLLHTNIILNRYMQMHIKQLKVTGYINKFSKLCGTFKNGFAI